MNPELRAGTELAGFRIESLIGRGAMGAAYLATDLRLERRVALKVLAPELAADARFRERFLRESRLAASLEHPHIVPIHAAGEVDGVLFLAMRFVRGSDLHGLIRKVGRLAPERAVALLSQVADALDAAHRAGLVHRDVKPGNILVADGPEAAEQSYLCDFGLAKHAATVASLTSERSLVGTIDYVAPEQIEGGAVDGRADVYGLGCVLYECLVGAPPFARGMELAVVYAHLNDPPPRPSERRPELPTALDAVIACALAKDPAARYASAGELAAAAGAALAGEQPGAPRAPAPARSRTFLIADIRGYTTYTRQHGDEAAAALAARFASLARQSVELHRGELVELRGDEALAVFDSSRDALRAAVALQRQARRAPLERGVGVGLDTGEAIPLEDGYRGAALNLAARLCAAAASGQILASDHVTHAAGPVDGIRYAARKPLRLKGLDAPVNAAEILPVEPYAPIVAVDAPPPRRRRAAGIAAVVAILGTASGITAYVRSTGTAKPTRRHAVSASANAGADADALVEIDPRTNRVVRTLTLPSGSQPRDVAVDPTGVWVANTGTHTVTHLDTTTGLPVTVGDVGSVQALAADSSAAWIVGQPDPVRRSLTLYRIDRGSTTPRAVSVPLAWRGDASFTESPAGNDDVAVGGGAIWIPVPGSGPYLDLLRVPFDGTPARIASPGAGFAGPVAFGAGRAWALGYASLHASSALLLRIANRAGAVPERLAPLARPGADSALTGAASPGAVAVGLGSVWVLQAETSTIWRFDLAGGLRDSVPLGRGTWTGLAVGAGAVWATNANDGTVVRINPTSHRAAKPIPVGSGVARIAASDAAIWVTVQATRPDLAQILPPPVVAAAPTRKGRTLQLVGDRDYDQWDGTSYDGGQWWLESATCNALLDHPTTTDRSQQTDLIPAVAKTLPTVSADGLTYRLTIRRGLRFSNGQALTAADVKATFERLLDPAANFDALVNSQYYSVISGYDRYTAKDATGKPLPDDAKTLSGITVAGDTVTFHLTQPDPILDEALAMRWACIVPRRSPHAHSALPPPATGPYMVVAHVPNRSATLVRNPYWTSNARIIGLSTSRLANVDRIEVRLSVPPVAALAMIEHGQADLPLQGLLSGPALIRAEGLPADRARLLVAPSNALHYLFFNTTAVNPARQRNACSSVAAGVA